MSMVLCPECGEETLEQLLSCPRCDEPIAQNQPQEKRRSVRMFLLGLAFICGLGIATLCNALGYTGWAMGLGMLGVACMVLLIFNMQSAK